MNSRQKTKWHHAVRMAKKRAPIYVTLHSGSSLNVTATDSDTVLFGALPKLTISGAITPDGHIIPLAVIPSEMPR